jgi:hypothetical protein
LYRVLLMLLLLLLHGRFPLVLRLPQLLWVYVAASNDDVSACVVLMVPRADVVACRGYGCCRWVPLLMPLGGSHPSRCQLCCGT